MTPSLTLNKVILPLKLLRHLRMCHNSTVNRRPIRIRVNNPNRRLRLQCRILILLPIRLLPLPKHRILEQMRSGLVTCANAPFYLVCVAVDVWVAGLAGVEAGFCHLVFGARDADFEGFRGGGVGGGFASYG